MSTHFWDLEGGSVPFIPSFVRMSTKSIQQPLLRLIVPFLLVYGEAPAQAPPPQIVPTAQVSSAQLPTDLGGRIEQLRPTYVLHPGDQILVRAFEMDEISERPVRVDGDGMINLPVLGRVKAGGISVEDLEAALVDSLKKYVKMPQVTITVVQFSTEPVFFVGAFKVPGIYPLGGRRTLVEMISSVGGLQPTASRRIQVTRRKEYGLLPFSNATASPDGSGTSIEIKMATLRANVNPADDIVLQPFDVVSVERAEMVYVTGEVGKVGAFELQERDSMSVIQVLTLAGGLSQSADKKNAVILRPVLNTSRRAAIAINLQRILTGEDIDRPLLPNDVLVVAKVHGVSTRTLLFALPLVSTALGLGISLSR